MNVLSLCELKRSLAYFGYRTYRDYLASFVWRYNKDILKQHDYYGTCCCCGTDQQIQMHHSRYSFLGVITRWPDFIFPLCREHHNEVHELAAQDNLTIQDATAQVLERYGKSAVPDTYGTPFDVVTPAVDETEVFGGSLTEEPDKWGQGRNDNEEEEELVIL